MSRHIIDRPRTASPSARLVQFLRLDRAQTPRLIKTTQVRGPARMQHFLRIARGQTV